MLRWLSKIFLIFLIFSPIRSNAQDDVEPEPDVSILFPSSGQAVQGSIPVRVDTSVQGFISAELTFAYQGDQTGTWFLISQSDEPLSEALMTEWDTTVLTDGIYNLRLVVELDNGTQLTGLVTGVRVRNYSPIETETPAPSPTSAPLDTPLPTETPLPSATPIPATPTALPPNALTLTGADIRVNFLRGAAGGIALVILAGLYLSFRNLFRK